MASLSSHIHQHQVHLSWSRDHAPQLTISSGDVVTFDCIEASNGQITRESTAAAIAAFKPELADPIFGPVFVREAEPGDALEIEVLQLEHSDWGWTALVPKFGLLADDFEDEGPQIRIWDLPPNGSRTFPFNNDITIPIRPFMGTMGVAPAEAGHFGTIPPLKTGGNIDCRHVTQGAKLLLPVKVAGALFSCGDGHVAQGDGEVCGTAIEVGMKVTLRFRLVKNQTHITTPHYRCPPRDADVLPDCGTYSTLGIDADLLEATKSAVREMVAWLSVEKKLARADAYILCSIAVDLKLAEVVDMPNYAVSATIPLNIFNDSHGSSA